MEEIWKDIKGYEGLYQAGTLGNIKSLRKNIVMNSYGDGNGYLRLTLYDKNKNQVSKKVHRLIAETFIDNPEVKPCTNHKNGNRSDNRVENLEWFTYSENAIHGFRELGRVNP